MSLYLNFKYLQCDVLSNMISTYCLDAYASQLWDYEDKRIEKYYVEKSNIIYKQNRYYLSNRN